MKHLKECSFCHKKVYKLAARGLCANCYYREKRNGTPGYQDRARKPCSIDGCEALAVGHGYCDTHYRRFRKTGNPLDERSEKWGIKQSHPLHHTWLWARRVGIVSEWQDFWVFIRAVGDRPTETHRLIRHDVKAPFGPGNANWRPKKLTASSGTHAERAEWARADRVSNPLRYKGYDLKKSYGISLDEYESILAAQGGGCAICNATDPGTRFKYLPVDHCHATGRVRGILCGPCNTAIGLLKEKPEALQAAIDYLRKHQPPDHAA